MSFRDDEEEEEGEEDEEDEEGYDDDEVARMYVLCVCACGEEGEEGGDVLIELSLILSFLLLGFIATLVLDRVLSICLGEGSKSRA